MQIYIVTLVSFFTLFFSQETAALIASPAARAIVPRSQPTSWSLPHRVDISGNKPRSLPRRVEIGSNTPPSRRAFRSKVPRENQQIPFAFCPEFFTQDPKECSMCGGDNNIKGTCDSLLVSGDQAYCLGGKPCRGYYCKCSDDGGPDNSPKVTMTSVVGDQTGIVVWEPMTLSEYHDLRASTTISLTETATTSGAGSGLETVAAVVFAGGIAWYLASQNAAAGAIVFQPPPQKPEGSREDDQSCKDQGEEPDCDTCGGNNPLGLCASGNQQNCPCEEQDCPKDKPPSCPAQDCNGNDSSLQCTAKGKLKGCQCCPEKLPKCPADDCKSDEEKDEDVCKADKFKGCPCESPDFESMDVNIDEPFPATNDAAALGAQAAISLQKLWGGDPNTIPGYQKKEDSRPFCLHGAAPNQPREPKEYCQCGENRATIWSVAPEATAPCPWSPESTGNAVTFSTPAPAPTPPPAPASPPPSTPTSKTC